MEEGTLEKESDKKWGESQYEMMDVELRSLAYCTDAEKLG